MKSLNLPPFEYKVKKAERADLDFRYDSEKVRRFDPGRVGEAAFYSFLIESKGYPPS